MSKETFGAMTYDGRYVKRHFKDRTTGLIRVIFHEGKDVLVPYQEWKAKSRMIGHSTAIRRCEITKARVA